MGSLNVDHTLRVPRIPVPGETLTAYGESTCLGGKGANQAVAAARAGGDVTMIGCVGQDDFGARYIEHLRGQGIRVDGILASEAPTGSALIAVDDRGENTIIVHPGANHALLPEHIERHADAIRAADALLLQLECPLPTVSRAAQIARAAGVRILLNPSPWSPGFHDAAIPVDVLIVNEHEATLLTGSALAEVLRNRAEILAKARCEMLVITRGGDSTLALTREQGTVAVAPPAVTPVDTVGAGDAFAGALVVALGERQPLEQALAFANAAGALATLKAGAQPSLPTRDEILAFQLPATATAAR